MHITNVNYTFIFYIRKTVKNKNKIMKHTYVKIPKSYKVGGQKIEVNRVERCNNNSVGTSFLAGGYIEIADKCNKCDSIPERMKDNTFYHELIHTILDTMGESELSSNEKFVSTFSSFLCEAMEKAYFLEED